MDASRTRLWGGRALWAAMCLLVANALWALQPSPFTSPTWLVKAVYVGAPAILALVALTAARRGRLRTVAASVGIVLVAITALNVLSLFLLDW